MNIGPGTSQPISYADQLLGVFKQLLAELQADFAEHLTLTLDSSLDRDLGLDSLTRVELMARIEKALDVSLPETLLSTAETPRDFLRAVLGAKGRTEIVALEKAEALHLAAVTTVPAQAATLVDVLKWHMANDPERPHIRLYADEAEGEVITCQGLWQGAARIASGLQGQGLAHGDRALIMLPSGRDYFMSFFGILLAGGVPVPLYPPGRLKQIEEHLLRHVAIAANSLARLMIVMPEAKTFAQLMHTRVETLDRVVTVAELTAAAGHDLELHLPAIAGSDTAFIQYTSGSTGVPKGVVLSHANLLANIRAMGRAVKVTSDDVFVSWLPLYHDMGLIGAWLGSLYHACPLVVMSPLAFIARPSRWLRAMHRFRGTLSAAPNFAYELCLRRIDDTEIAGLDLSAWRCAFNGAEAVSPATIERFTERFAGYGFRSEAMMPVYGLAESSVGLAFPPLGSAPIVDRINRRELMAHGRAVAQESEEIQALRFAGCGRPLPGHQIRIVDAAGRELPDRCEGRLQFKGPSSTSGYFRDQQKNKELFDGLWLNSGDKAYIADGDVFITGRSKDIIIRAGRNIYPEELEEAISMIDGVRSGNVAVFGSMDREEGTERLIVLTETRKREPDSRAALRAAINSVVNDLTGSPPDEVILAVPNTVLKTSSGKIRRAASRDLYERGEIGRPQPPVWLQILRFSLAATGPRLRHLARSLAETVFAGYAWVLFVVSAPIVWLSLVVLPWESWRWALLSRMIRSIFRLAGVPVAVQGLENLVEPEGPWVLVSNHASYLDGIVLAGFIPQQLSFIAKAELKKSFFVRSGLMRLGVEFVERFDKERGVADARELVRRGRSGRSMLFFAEGTFMRMPGLLPFRLGAFETAVAGNLPLIPVVIRGTRSLLRADSWFPRRGRVKITIGEAIRPEQMLEKSGGDHFAAVLLLRDTARQWMVSHCGEPDLEHERPPLLAGDDHAPDSVKFSIS